MKANNNMNIANIAMCCIGTTAIIAGMTSTNSPIGID